jgi:Domain of unknown function (DUF4383)
MTNRTIVLILGLAFTTLGVVGFIPAVVYPAPLATPELITTPGYGYLFGLFPVNLWHNVVHLLFGIWGLSASRMLLASERYGRSLAFLYGALAIMGLIPFLNTTFGLIPLFGHDVWLHAVIAAIGAYVGFGGTRAETLDQGLRRRAG